MHDVPTGKKEGAVPDTVDTRGLGELTEASEDLHSDAMRQSRTAFDAYVESAADPARDPAPHDQAARDQAARERAGRFRRGRGPAVAAGLAGAGVVAMAARASAATPDVAILQTAASIENLAVGTYSTALTLPFIGGSSANAVVKAFATKTMAQHSDHAKAFNAAAVKLGGKAQTNPDPKYAKIVEAAVPTIKGPADVVALATTLEDVAAQTYTRNVGLVGSAELRQLFGSVAAVEAQHRAILLAVAALLKGNAADLITLPPPAAKLPAAAGSVGFPDAFYPTRMASPSTEGALA